MNACAASSAKFTRRVNGALGLFIAARLVWPQLNPPLSAGIVWLVFSYPVFSAPRPANMVTALRLAIALGAFAAQRDGLLSWQGFILAMILALALDGVDGWLARRTGPTAFGGVFDMECDNAWLAVVWLSLWEVAGDARLIVGFGLLIPAYRIGIVGLRWFLARQAKQAGEIPAARPLLGLPRAKVLFVVVAVLSIAALFALQLVPHELASWLLGAATAGAVACSTASFWPEYRALLWAPTLGKKLEQKA